MHDDSEGHIRVSSRHGSCLHHGSAHETDHALWTRRDFLSRSMLALTSASFLFQGQPVRALSRLPLAASAQAFETDRILVLIQLKGGNDGLNTVVPYRNDVYFQNRPQLALNEANRFALDDTFALHSALSPLESFWGEGRLGIVHGVGYPDPNLSHFESTDTWVSGGNPEAHNHTGWVGRILDREYPDFQDEPPAYPLAVQVGRTLPTFFQGPSTNMGMSFLNSEILARVAETGNLYDPLSVPDTLYGSELAFVRTVANSSFRYAETLQVAADQGRNDFEYPDDKSLAKALATVARLIKGGLETRLYIVSLGGFDTHALQGNAHARLLETLSNAVTAFFADLAQTGNDQRVAAMTFSEFGRRVEQNLSQGTDHGTAAPLFVIGPQIEGGFYSRHPDLEDLDHAGNMKYTTDFRSVYATLLQDWLGLNPDAVEATLGSRFETLPFVASPLIWTSTTPDTPDLSFDLHPNYPNPFTSQTTLSYRLASAGSVRLEVYDVQGRHIETVVDAVQPAGLHSALFDASGLPAGTYLYRLISTEGVRTRTMTILR